MPRTDTVGYKVRLIHNQIHKMIEEKKAQNEGIPLTGMQHWTMGYLQNHEGEEVYQRDIEAAFSVSRATASNMLTVMERRGLIERVSVQKDARLKKIILTDLARGMTAQAERDMQEMEALLVSGMNEEEQLQFRRSLDKVLKNLGIEEEQEDHCWQKKKADDVK